MSEKNYVISENGIKKEIKLKNNKIYEKACIVDKNTYLKKKWLLYLYKLNDTNDSNDSEFVKQISFNQKPTEEQIMFHLITNDIGRYRGYASIDEVYTLEYGVNEEEE